MRKNLLMLAVFLTVSALQGGNLVKNGNFTEKTSDGKIAGWDIWPAQLHPDAEVALDTTISMSGGQSVRITQKRHDLYSRIQQLHIPCKPHTRYVARFYARGLDIHTEKRGGARMFIGPYGDLSRPLVSFGPGVEQFAISVPDYWTFGWKLYESGIFNSGDSKELGVTLYLLNASGTVWFDNVEIYEYTPELQKERLASRARQLIRQDIAIVYKLAPELEAELDCIRQKNRTFYPDVREPRIGMPFFSLQRELGAVFSRHLRRYFPNTSVVVSPVSEPLASQECYMIPTGKLPAKITLRGLKGGTESFAVNLTNTTSENQTVEIHTSADLNLVLRLATHVETDRLNYVDDALLLMRPVKNSQYAVTIPPGMTRQVYCSARLTRKLSGSIRFGKTAVHIELLPSSLSMPEMLPMKMFSYAYLYHPHQLDKRYEATRKMLNAMHDNTVLPYQFDSPLPVFDENGVIQTEKMDWSKIDRSMAMKAQPVSVIVNLPVYSEPHISIALGKDKGKSIAPYSLEWERRIILWLRALVPEFNARGIGYDRLYINLRDEPAEKDIDYLERLAKVIRRADPNLKIYNNFHYALSKQSIMRLANAIDVIAPELEMMTPDKMKILHESGKEIWMYHVQNRSYPAHKIRDCFRMLKRENVTGYSYWCFFDRNPEWEPKGAQSYSVVYDGDSAEWTPSKRSEAIRMGLEDYTLLTILQERNLKIYAELMKEEMTLSRNELRARIFDLLEQ